MMATSGNFANPFTKASISAFGVTPPVGLAGEFKISSRVCGVISASVSAAEKANPFSSRTGTGTARAPVYSIIER